VASATAAWEAQQQRVAAAPPSAAQAARTAQARFAGTLDQAQAVRSLAQPQAAPAPFAAQPAPQVNFAASRPIARPAAAGARIEETVKLPSGLAALSIATARHRTVAIDQAGALFVRQEPGGEWEPVTRQWTGRALHVRALPAWPGNAASAPPPPAGLFDLENDNHLVWTSQDGKTWKAQ
jgi:hypothetical protein